jgi:hypothetical protein
MICPALWIGVSSGRIPVLKQKADSLKILIAEDENIARMVLAASLKNHGHEVVAVENGLKAWEAFQTEGLLPICSGCKKIRDANGVWQRVENYIETHSEAQFTHGYCPECYEKYMKSNFTG